MMNKVKNAATHVKEGGADIVGTLKHGGGQKDSGADNASGKTNTQAAKEQAATAARNAKGALRGEQPAATGEEYTNSTEATQQTAHPQGTTGADDNTTSTHDVSTIKQGFKMGPDALAAPSDSGPGGATTVGTGVSAGGVGALGSSSGHKDSGDVLRPPGEGARIMESKHDERSFVGVGGATDDFKQTASGTPLRVVPADEGGLGSADAAYAVRNEPRPGVETYGSSNPAAPEPKSIQEGYNTHTPMVQTTGDEGKKFHTGAGIDGEAERMQDMSLAGKSGGSGGVGGMGGMGDTQGMPKDEAALMGMDAQGTGLQQSGSEQGGVIHADSKRM